MWFWPISFLPFPFDFPHLRADTRVWINALLSCSIVWARFCSICSCISSAAIRAACAWSCWSASCTCSHSLTVRSRSTLLNLVLLLLDHWEYLPRPAIWLCARAVARYSVLRVSCSVSGHKQRSSVHVLLWKDSAEESGRLSHATKWARSRETTNQSWHTHPCQCVRATHDQYDLSCTAPLCWTKQRTYRQHHESQSECYSRAALARSRVRLSRDHEFEIWLPTQQYWIWDWLTVRKAHESTRLMPRPQTWSEFLQHTWALSF